MPDITQEDVNRLGNILNRRQGQLHVGIANAFSENIAPSVDESLAFLREVSGNFSNFLRAHPNDLGLLVTPEWYLSNRYAQNQGIRNADSVSNLYKHAVRDISEENPNLIYNVAGLYHKPLLKNYYNPRSHEKLQKRLGLFESLLNQPIQNLQLYTDRPNNIDNLHRGINNFWEDYGRNPAISPALTNSLIAKNQSNYHWKGNKIGSYNKSTYADDITNSMSNNNIRGYIPGNWRMKSYGEEGNPLNQASQLLCDSIHPELCADAQFPHLNPHYQGAPKKIYTLQSNETGLPPQRSPLSIYADNAGLTKFMPSEEGENMARVPVEDFRNLFQLEPRQNQTHLNFNGQYYWPVVHNNTPVGIAHEQAKLNNDNTTATHQFLRFNPVRF